MIIDILSHYRVNWTTKKDKKMEVKRKKKTGQIINHHQIRRQLEYF